MSDTIWFLREGHTEDGDDYDHTLMLNASEQLDALAESLGVQKLSGFHDYSDLEFNMSEEELDEEWIAENSQWHDPAPALESVTTLLANLGKLEIPEEDRQPLQDELEDCHQKLRNAVADGAKFHFCIVM
jgi:hypothetical protein